MKRLTKRTKAGTANIDYDGCTFPNGKEDYIAKSARRQLAIERFADIEDILCDGEDEYEQDLNRLRRLVEADRDGRCVVLPRLEPGHGDNPGAPGAPGPPGIATEAALKAREQDG